MCKWTWFYQGSYASVVALKRHNRTVKKKKSNLVLLFCAPIFLGVPGLDHGGRSSWKIVSHDGVSNYHPFPQPVHLFRFVSSFFILLHCFLILYLLFSLSPDLFVCLFFLHSLVCLPIISNVLHLILWLGYCLTVLADLLVLLATSWMTKALDALSHLFIS